MPEAGTVSPGLYERCSRSAADFIQTYFLPSGPVSPNWALDNPLSVNGQLQLLLRAVAIQLAGDDLDIFRRYILYPEHNLFRGQGCYSRTV